MIPKAAGISSAGNPKSPVRAMGEEA